MNERKLTIRQRLAAWLATLGLECLAGLILCATSEWGHAKTTVVMFSSVAVTTTTTPTTPTTTTTTTTPYAIKSELAGNHMQISTSCLTPLYQGTLMGWVYLRSDQYHDWIYAGNSNRSNVAIFYPTSGRVMRWQVLSLLVDGPALSLTNWHHVAEVVGSSGNTQYVDGVAVSVTPGGSGNPGTNFFSVVNYGATPLSFVGRLFYNGTGYSRADYWWDDLAVFNRCLTSNEIASVYNSGSPPHSDTNGSPWNSGLVALWRADEGTGTTVSDASANGWTGTLNTATAVWTNGIVP